MLVSLICIPYDSGFRGERMGAGPNQLIESGLVEHLLESGHEVDTVEVTLPPGTFRPEIQAAFELDRLLAPIVRDALTRAAFPIVLSGNCITSLGTIAGIGGRDLGIMWFDAHGDFNTPETTTGGFLDGMALAIATGRCWRPLAASIPGFSPVADARVMMFGARDLDPDEGDALGRSGIARMSAASARAGASRAFSKRADKDQPVYLHVDLDVLDPAEGKANGFAAPDGLSVSELRGLMTEIAGHFRVRAAAFTAYDPTHDSDGRIAAGAIGTIVTLVDSVAKAKRSVA